MTRLHDIHWQQGQSIWLDSLSRSSFADGYLQGLIDDGIRGLTSNPTLMAQAIHSDSAYDQAIRALHDRGADAEDGYWDLVNTDVEHAAALFAPTYAVGDGQDGFVSVEVAPTLAFDAAATTASAISLRKRFDAPNIMIKIPATLAGLQAIEDVTAAGVSVNATLIFSVARYRAVARAYVRGLERWCAGGGDPSDVASVASFFISRVDTEVDSRLESLIASAADPGIRSRAADLLGRAAVAQAQLAYGAFLEDQDGALGQRLAQIDGRPQRLLWASTSVKNPAYDKLHYVDPLIAPATVNTMAISTIGDVVNTDAEGRSVGGAFDFDAARGVFQELDALGIDRAEVADLLEQRGVAAFRASFDEVLSELAAKTGALASTR